MRWLLAGYCGLALISVSLNHALRITQKPRFYGLKSGHSVSIYCLSAKQQLVPKASWYKAAEFNGTKKLLSDQSNKRGFLIIEKVRVEDSGVYFCNADNTWGPGTALQVIRPTNITLRMYRTKMKDGLIILQGLLLAVCIAAIVQRKRKLLETKDSIYEEPETDHIYEGLAIETCGGGLYEELSVYAQADGAEAPWE